jgi:hypothetical protein
MAKSNIMDFYCLLPQFRRFGGASLIVCQQCCGTGTGTFCRSGTRTVIKLNHKSSHLKFFHLHFTINFDETSQFFPCKKARFLFKFV